MPRKSKSVPARRSSQLATATVAAIGDLSALQQAIRTARAECRGHQHILPERPLGSFTLGEYARDLNICEDTAYGQLHRLLRDGKYVRVMAYSQVPAQSINGYRVQAMWHYFPKPKE